MKFIFLAELCERDLTIMPDWMRIYNPAIKSSKNSELLIEINFPKPPPSKTQLIFLKLSTDLRLHLRKSTHLKNN